MTNPHVPAELQSPDTQIRVFLVDDHSIFRAGLRAELGSVGAGQLDIVGESDGVRDAVAKITQLEPDVVLLDVHMPDGGGLAIVQQCMAAGQRTRFLCLSVSDAAEDVIALIRAGARGYVTKTIEPRELVSAIGRVHSGDAVFSPKLAGYVLDAFSTPTSGQSNQYSAGAGEPVAASEEDEEKRLVLDELTRREKEVLRLLARGYTYREMAERLFISVKTVETHVSNILRKTQQSNRHALTRWVGDR